MITIAAVTVLEIVRRRFAVAAVCATLAIVALSGWGFGNLEHIHRAHGRPLTPLEIKAIASVLVILIVYLFSFVLAVAAVLLAAPTLAAEVDSGVLLPVLARPISHAAIVMGKAIGLATALCCYAGVAGLVELTIVRTITGYVPPHPVSAVAALATLGLVVLALALAVSTRLQTIATSIIAVAAFGLSWMAGIVASFASIYHDPWLVRAGVISQLLLPSDAMWRIAIYQLEPAILVNQAQASGQWQGPFFVTAPPPPAMEVWTLLWIIAVMFIAIRSFSTRDA